MLMCSCASTETDDKNVAEKDKQLLEIAKQYIIHNYPDSTGVFELKPLISEKNGYWEVTYELPELTLGGVPVIHISKDKLEVIKAFHYQ